MSYGPGGGAKMACVPIRRQMTCAGWQNRRPTPDAKLGGVAPVRAVLLDFYCTLVDLRDPVRSRGFDDLARRLGLLLGPGEFYRRYAEMISSEPAEDGGSGFVPYRTSWLAAGRWLLAPFGRESAAGQFADCRPARRSVVYGRRSRSAALSRPRRRRARRPRHDQHSPHRRDVRHQRRAAIHLIGHHSTSSYAVAALSGRTSASGS
jgi:hypothetical protein